MCKGSNTTTSSTTNAPNPQAGALYSSLLGQASNVAATPYSPYGGELVAPVNQEQYGGISGINEYANAAQPGLMTAEGLMQGAANPLTTAQINQYYSPYQQEVVGATEQQFANTNAQQQQQVLGNAAAQGALGGDRTAVAQSVLAGQQQTQEAPVIAGLENQGYTQALQTAQQEYQQNPEAAAYGLGNTAQALENAGLTGANAQIGAGTLEQQTQQAADTAAYNQYLAEMAYPFQTTQWLAGIGTGVGSQMGGTSTGETTAPAPSLISELTGLGTFGIGLGGLIGSQPGTTPSGGTTGGSGLSGLFANWARGGRVRRADGGSTMYPQFGGGYGNAVMPYSGAQSFVPGTGITRGPGPPRAQAPSIQNQQNSSAQMFQNAAKLAGGFAGNQGQNANQGGLGPIGPVGTSPEVADILNQPSGAMISDSAVFRRGGTVKPYGGLPLPNHNRIMLNRGGTPIRAGLGIASFVPRRYDDGGGVSIVPEQLSPAEIIASRFAPAGGLAQAPTSNPDSVGNLLALQAYGQLSPQGPQNAPPPSAGVGNEPPQADAAPPPLNAPAATQGGLGAPMQIAPAAPPAMTEVPPRGMGAGLSSGVPETAAADVGAAPSGGGGLFNHDVSMALMAAGLGMMGGRSPFPFVNIGEGGMQGLETYGELQKQEQDVGLKVKQLNQQAKEEQDRLALEAKKYTDMTPAEQAEIALKQQELAKPFQVGTNMATGMPMYAVHDPKAPNGFRIVDMQGMTGNPSGTGAPMSGGPAVAPPGGAPAGSAAAQLPATAAPTAGEAPANVRPEVLQSLDPTLASTVKALDEGRMQFPSGFALKSPYWQNILRLVSNYDPSFDAVNYNARARTRQDFTAGKSAQNITSFNTAIGHLGTLNDSIDALGNTNFSWLNSPLQAVKGAAGDTEFQAAQKRFMAAKQAVTDELTRAFRGSGGNVHDIVGWEQTLNQADSPAALHAAVKSAVDLLHSRIESVGDQYNRGMGTTRDPLTLLSPHAQATVNRLEGGEGAGANLSAQDTAALNWANSNPNDPRAAQIKQRLGVQ